MSTLTSMLSFIQHSFGSPTHSNQRREIKGIQIGKEIKPSLFADDMKLYIEKPKHSSRKLSELINEFNNISGYKIHTNLSYSYILTSEDKKKKLKT